MQISLGLLLIYAGTPRFSCFFLVPFHLIWIELDLFRPLFLATGSCVYEGGPCHACHAILICSVMLCFDYGRYNRLARLPVLFYVRIQMRISRGSTLLESEN
jgi:hypothetical protein